MQQTRQKLLENFDEEVHEKLKISDRRAVIISPNLTTGFGNWTKFYLRDFAQFEAIDNGRPQGALS